MFTFNDLSRNTQRVVCLLLSATIVGACLAFAIFVTQPDLHGHYSVTVTQLQ